MQAVNNKDANLFEVKEFCRPQMVHIPPPAEFLRLVARFKTAVPQEAPFSISCADPGPTTGGEFIILAF